ncbi:MAG: hypothetical protein WC046_09745 [Candidatus Bathyarchaeia archaeon]
MFPEEIIRKFEFIIYYGYSIGPPMTQDPEYRAIAEWLKKCVIDRNCRIEILPCTNCNAFCVRLTNRKGRSLKI